MTSLAWLLPAALVLGLAGLAAFLWALRDGQFDDLEGAGWRALDDIDIRPKAPSQAASPSATTPSTANAGAGGAPTTVGSDHG